MMIESKMEALAMVLSSTVHFLREGDVVPMRFGHVNVERKHGFASLRPEFSPDCDGYFREVAPSTYLLEVRSAGQSSTLLNVTFVALACESQKR